MGTQEHLETPKRTGETGTRDHGSAGTPEYIKMEASKINPLRTVQCRLYIHDIDVEREREGEGEGEGYFHSNVSKVGQRVLLFICTSLSNI